MLLGSTALLTAVHVLAGAAWFGAMFYSTFVLHPRGHAFFADDVAFERFITSVSHGARWKVLGALAVIGLSGAGLALLRVTPPSPGWWWVIAAKVVLLVAAVGLFIHVSWRLWPARLFASPEEVPGFQQRFRRVAWTMLTIAGLSIVLGVVAHFV